MAQPAWEHIGVYQAGVVPVLYQQVKCSRSGGVRFSIAGFNYFLLINIQNLSGSGSVGNAWIKGDNTGWIQMSRNWGANWQALSGLVGQSLSFAVTSTGGQCPECQHRNRRGSQGRRDDRARNQQCPGRPTDGKLPAAQHRPSAHGDLIPATSSQFSTMINRPEDASVM